MKFYQDKQTLMICLVLFGKIKVFDLSLLFSLKLFYIWSKFQ